MVVIFWGDGGGYQETQACAENSAFYKWEAHENEWETILDDWEATQVQWEAHTYFKCQADLNE